MRYAIKRPAIGSRVVSLVEDTSVIGIVMRRHDDLRSIVRWGTDKLDMVEWDEDLEGEAAARSAGLL